MWKHRYHLHICALAALLSLLLPEASYGEVRVALVIGNSAYRHAPRLPNPVNDAADVASSLQRAGFETVVATDLDKAGMDAAAIRFARLARSADVAMFYYSGHAIQFGGVNYLVPVDAELRDEADLRRMARLDEVVSDLQQAKNLRILVLDACRDNPLAEELKRSIGTTRALPLQRGLAKIDSPQGMIVAYATQAGRTAEDGRGRNSPYTTAFLKHIEAQEEIGTIFRRISSDVYTATRQTQLPELSLSLIGEYYLRGRVGLTIRQDAPAAPTDAARADFEAAERVDSVLGWDTFLARHPNSFYAALAQERRQKAAARVAALSANIAPPSAPSAAAAPASPQRAPSEVAALREKYRGWTLTPQVGHSNSVVKVAITPDGDRIVSASWDHTIKIWDAADGSLLHTLLAHASVNGLAISLDGRRIAANDSKGWIHLWNAANGAHLNSFAILAKGDTLPNAKFAVSPDGERIVTTDSDGSMKIWNAVTGSLLRTINAVKGNEWKPVRAIAITPDGNRIVSADGDHAIRIRDAASGALLRTLKGHTDLVDYLALTADGSRIASSSADGTVRIWLTASGALQQTVRVQPDQKKNQKDKSLLAFALASPFAISRDGSRAFTADAGRISIWDVSSATLLRSFSGVKKTGKDELPDLIHGVAVSPDGKRLVTANAAQNVRVFDLETSSLLRALDETPNQTFAALLSPDESRIVSAGREAIKIWEAGRGLVLRTVEGPPARTLALSPDGNLIAADGGADKSVRIWDAASGSLPRTLTGHTETIEALAISPDGNRVIAVGTIKTVKIWDIRSGSLVGSAVLAGADGLFGARISRDGSRVVSRLNLLSNDISVWDVETGRLARTIKADSAFAVDVSPDGRWIAAAHLTTGEIQIWDVASGKLARTLRGHTAMVDDLTFSADGRLLMSGSHDGTIRIWEAASGNLLRTVPKHKTATKAFAISRDGNRVIGGGAELASYDFNRGGWQWSAIAHGVQLLRADGSFWTDAAGLERLKLVRGTESMPLPDDYKAALLRELPLNDAPVAAAK